jgi:putative two-component system response regulator
VALYVRHHHEHFDGSGYPEKLEGSRIPLPSRIILIVDAFDAMITDRPYRPALTRKAAFEKIRDGRGKQFDPQLVDLLFQLEKKGVIDDVWREVEKSDA